MCFFAWLKYLQSMWFHKTWACMNLTSPYKICNDKNRKKIWKSNCSKSTVTITLTYNNCALSPHIQMLPRYPDQNQKPNRSKCIPKQQAYSMVALNGWHLRVELLIYGVRFLSEIMSMFVSLVCYQSQTHSNISLQCIFSSVFLW